MLLPLYGERKIFNNLEEAVDERVDLKIVVIFAKWI